MARRVFGSFHCSNVLELLRCREPEFSMTWFYWVCGNVRYGKSTMSRTFLGHFLLKAMDFPSLFHAVSRSPGNPCRAVAPCRQPTGQYKVPARPFPLPSENPGSLGLAPSGRSWGRVQWISMASIAGWNLLGPLNHIEPTTLNGTKFGNQTFGMMCHDFLPGSWQNQCFFWLPREVLCV